MAKLSIQGNTTSISLPVFIQANNVTTGAGLTGLGNGTAGLTCYYSLNAGNSTVVTLANLTNPGSAYSSGGFVQIDSTNMPGLYRLDIPNAALAGPNRSCVVCLQGAANMAQTYLEIELTGWNNQDGIHGGMSALPNTAVTTNASLITSGTGTAQLSTSTGNVTLATTQAFNNTGTWTGNLTANLSGTVGNISGTAQVNTVQIGGTVQTARDVGGAVPAAAAGASGGLLISGSNSGNTTLAALTVTGALTVSAGMVLNQSTTNGSGLTVNGNGNGPGVSINAGGSGNASGAVFSGTGTGHGISSAGGTTGNGLQLSGGSSSGDGIHILTTSGIGLHISATGGVSISAPTITANITGNITGGFSVTSPANVLQINGNSTAASNLGITTNDILRGTVTTGASTTSIPTSAFTGAGVNFANQFSGRVILFDGNTTTTGLQGVAATILTSGNASTPTFTTFALPTTPASGDTFSVV